MKKANNIQRPRANWPYRLPGKKNRHYGNQAGLHKRFAAKMIKIDTAKSTRMKDELTLSGEVSFDDNKGGKGIPLYQRAGNTEVKVSLGDKVSKGQTLAIIRSADVAGSYTDLSATKSDLAINKRQLEQAEYLYKNGISSERDYTEAKENYNKAVAANSKVRDQIAINGGGNTSASGCLL
jgi:cobalt-zinc-cadmium efflux system membrane fusion protein